MKFNYKIIDIDYIHSTLTVKYWCEGMTVYNGISHIINFNVNFLVDKTEKEFDRMVYNIVKNNFILLTRVYKEYKDGKHDLLEKVAETVRSIDVV